MSDPTREGLEGPGDLELDDEGLEALATALATPPPAELRARVLAETRRLADSERTELRLRRWRRVSAAAIAACAGLAALVAYEVRDTRATAGRVLDLERDRVELSARLEEQQRDFGLLEDALDVQSEVMRILSAPRLITASLTPLAGAPLGSASGTARVLLDPTTGAVAVIGSGLPPPQTGRVYELWAIRSGRDPVPAGTLAPAAERSFAVRLRHMEDPRDVTEFAISLEPPGGAERPTGPIVLAGAVER